MNRILALSILLISVLYGGWKRIIGHSDTPVPPEKKVLKSDTLGLYIRATVFGFTQEDTTVDGMNFGRVLLNGLNSSMISRAPDCAVGNR